MARRAVPLTVREVSRALGLSASTIRRDVARGCDGIVRPGEIGRSRGALLDLERYRAWREGRRVDERALEMLAESAIAVLREHGGQTRALRSHAAFILLALYLRAHQALLRADGEIPAKLRTACAIYLESGGEVRP